MISWPLALICIITVICITIIVCAGQLWNDEWQQWKADEHQDSPSGIEWLQSIKPIIYEPYELGGDDLPTPQPTRPSPARRPDYGSDPPTPEPIVTHNHEHQWVDNTALNELPNSRYLCAVCSASRLDLADCDEPTTTH